MKHAVSLFLVSFGCILLCLSGAIGSISTRLINNPIIPTKKQTSAFDCSLKALAQSPHIQEYLCGIAQTYMQQHRSTTASAFLLVAHTIDPQNPAIRLLLAETYCTTPEIEKAQEILKPFLSATLSLPDKQLLQAARILSEIGHPQKALEYAQLAVTKNPQNALALATVGNMYNRQGDLEKAVTYYKKALALQPNIPNIIYNLGYTLKRLGKLHEALPYFDQAIALKPGYLDAIIDRAYTYWALGDFAKAWQDYALRFKMHGNDPTRTLPMPLWDGRDLQGKTILLYAEQGLGDTLQFIRLAQAVKKRGNPSIICKVQKPLVKLLQSYPYIDKLVTSYETQGIDYQAPLMSLPGILTLTPATIPAPNHYLYADKKLVSQWHTKLKDTAHTLRVGLCWHVDPIHEKDKSPVSRRSIPVKEFLIFESIPNLTFFALQQGDGLSQINELPETFPLTAFDAYFDKRHGSFMDSAAVIENLDIVITVDTAIAHLAGALGKEVWIFLPYSPDGRWSYGTNKTPWYPTATLFRQTDPKNWHHPLQEMKKLLHQRALQKGKTT